FSTPKGNVIRKLIKHDISVYASHTNLDIAEDGVNDLLSDALQLEHRKHLIPFLNEKLTKLIVFVPVTHANKVRNALSEAGAGHIGNYSHCTFQTQGEGTFMPLEGTDPFSGTKNELSIVDELKIETIVREEDLQKVINAMKRTHPYEEVAYDLYPLKNKGKTFGLGRIGKLNEKVNLKSFCDMVKQVLDAPNLMVTGDLSQ